MLKDFSQSLERYSLPERSECLELSVLVGQDLDSMEGSSLSEGHFTQLKDLAKNQLRSFLDSRFIHEAVPENSKMMAVSSNLPLFITLSFLLEDKKKSLLVYDELEDCIIGSFTCSDVLLIFYMMYALVKDEQGQELDGNFPFRSLEELSRCSTKFWLVNILETNKALSGRVISMRETLYQGLKLCLELESNYKRIRLRDEELGCMDVGTWVIEDRGSRFEFEFVKEDLKFQSSGLYPVCYFSPLTLLSDLVQNLQICSGYSRVLQSEDQEDLECELSHQGSVLGRVFHNKVLRHLGMGRSIPKCIKMGSPFKCALELFLREGLTHIPIVANEDDTFTGMVLTIEKCCTYLARCVSSQEKARMDDPIESIFSIGNREGHDMLGNTVLQLSGQNCGENCFEYNSLSIVSNIEGRRMDDDQTNVGVGHEGASSTFLADICLSGAISHILLSEDQCLILVDRKTNQVTALLTALDVYSFYNDPEFMKMYSLKVPIKLAHEFSRFVNEDQFTRKFPHLKRMRKVVKGGDGTDASGSSDGAEVEILIGESVDSLPAEAEAFLRESGIGEAWSEIEVPRTPPLTREKFGELSKIWPLSFLKPRFNPEMLSDQMQRESDRFVRLAVKVGEFSSTNGNPPRGCVITLKGKIVAIGEDSRHSEYPWMHSVMKAIDNFSRRVILSSPPVSEASSSREDDLERGNGVEEGQVGLSHVDIIRSRYHVSEDDILSDSELGGQYLCTNGIAYLSHEPCISCSMALVHSRISKVFYMYTDKDRGFLGSRHKLHCVAELNHHYRVYRANGGKCARHPGSQG
ncbi:hypothetical protein OIY81_2087 [Cryptosporidium canis]|nr:hypothetical protein OIY81_2087 [Cryptosporidium canis]